MYDQRRKAQREFAWALSGAREEGERLGMEKGNLAGKIQMLQEWLGEIQSAVVELQALSTDILSVRLADLQQRVRERVVGGTSVDERV